MQRKVAREEIEQTVLVAVWFYEVQVKHAFQPGEAKVASTVTASWILLVLSPKMLERSFFLPYVWSCLLRFSSICCKQPILHQEQLQRFK